MSKPTILAPIDAGKLFLAAKESPFQIFCVPCGGWVVWQEGQVECPACGRPNAEAYAFNVGVRQAREVCAAPAPQ
jgi:Zn finger protein HypA/HybF involved in hydrogenase expression